MQLLRKTDLFSDPKVADCVNLITKSSEPLICVSLFSTWDHMAAEPRFIKLSFIDLELGQNNNQLADLYWCPHLLPSKSSVSSSILLAAR